MGRRKKFLNYDPRRDVMRMCESVKIRAVRLWARLGVRKDGATSLRHRWTWNPPIEERWEWTKTEQQRRILANLWTLRCKVLNRPGEIPKTFRKYEMLCHVSAPVVFGILKEIDRDGFDPTNEDVVDYYVTKKIAPGLLWVKAWGDDWEKRWQN